MKDKLKQLEEKQNIIIEDLHSLSDVHNKLFDNLNVNWKKLTKLIDFNFKDTDKNLLHTHNKQNKVINELRSFAKKYNSAINIIDTRLENLENKEKNINNFLVKEFVPKHNQLLKITDENNNEIYKKLNFFFDLFCKKMQIIENKFNEVKK